MDAWKSEKLQDQKYEGLLEDIAMVTVDPNRKLEQFSKYPREVSRSETNKSGLTVS